jgi:hypothetical protein
MRITTNPYLSGVMNSYSLSNFLLKHYNQFNVVQTYILYPLLLDIIKNKGIVILILAFI